MLEEKVKILNEILVGFRESGYPFNLYEYCGHGIDLHIRQPPLVPGFISGTFSESRDQLRACPAINRIYLPDRLQGIGLFKDLVQGLYGFDDVMAVCVTEVSNPRFRRYLESTTGWNELEHPALPQLLEELQVDSDFSRHMPKHFYYARPDD